MQMVHLTSTHLSRVTDSADWLRRQENNWGQARLRLRGRHVSNNMIVKKKKRATTELGCPAFTCFNAFSLRIPLQHSALIKLALQQSISVKCVLVGQGIKSIPSKLQQIKGK